MQPLIENGDLAGQPVDINIVLADTRCYRDTTAGGASIRVKTDRADFVGSSSDCAVNRLMSTFAGKA